MGVPAGAVLTVRVPPPGNGMDVPGSVLRITGCKPALAMGWTRMASLPIRSSCPGARNLFPDWGLSIDATIVSI